MQGAIFSGFTSIIVLCLAGTSSLATESPPAPARLVSMMGDHHLTQDERSAAAGSLIKLGKDAMPALIDSLRDNRIYYPNYETSSGVNGPSVSVDVTVGMECDYILTNIVSNGASGHPMGFRYKVWNWPDWWRKHKDMTQADIQKEAKWYNRFIMESTGEGDRIPHINGP